MPTTPLQRVETAPLRPVVDFRAARPRRARRSSRRRFRFRLRMRRKEVVFTLIAVALACLIAPMLLGGGPPTHQDVPPRPSEPRLLH